VNGWEI